MAGGYNTRGNSRAQGENVTAQEMSAPSTQNCLQEKLLRSEDFQKFIQDIHISQRQGHVQAGTNKCDGCLKSFGEISYRLTNLEKRQADLMKSMEKIRAKQQAAVRNMEERLKS